MDENKINSQPESSKEDNLDPGVYVESNPMFDDLDVTDSPDPWDKDESANEEESYDPEELSVKEYDEKNTIFSAPTPMLDVNEVNKKSEEKSDAQTDASFNSPTPILNSQDVADNEASSFDFMSSMKELYNSMQTGNESAPAASATPATPAAPVENAPAESAEGEQKNGEYWDYMDKLIDRFDDGKVHTDIGESAASTAEETEKKSPEIKTPETIESVNKPDEKMSEAEAEAVKEDDAVAAAAAAAEKAVEPAAAVSGSSRYDAFESASSSSAAPVLSSDDLYSTNQGETVAEEEKQKKKSLFGKKKSSETNSESVVTEEPVEVVIPSGAQPTSDKNSAKEAAKAEKLKQKAEKQAKKAKPEKAEAVAGVERKGIKKAVAAVVPVKGDSKKEIVRKIVVIVSFITLAVCAIILIFQFVQQKNNEKYSAELASIMSSSSSTDSWDAVHTKYPKITFPDGMNIKFADLYAINQDIVGWINIDGMSISYPVTQASDDTYYLKHNFYKEDSKYGCIFMSAANSITSLDKNTVIYGHTMRDGQMFAALHNYKSVDGFLASPIIEYNTLYKDYKFKVYAVYITNGDSSGDNGNLLDYTFTDLTTEEAFAGYVAQLNQRQLYDTGVDIKPDDKLITLSTCTYEFDNARLVVVGRLLRDGESEDIDKSLVKVNGNPRYPQAYYDANNMTNIYSGYKSWEAS